MLRHCPNPKGQNFLNYSLDSDKSFASEEMLRQTGIKTNFHLTIHFLQNIVLDGNEKNSN